jgi:hypothetical protein
MQGASTITATLSSGTGSAVSFSASGLPAGATAVFSRSSCTPTCTSTMTIQTSASTPVGSYPVTVTGTGGGKSHTTSFMVTVNAPTAPFDFSLSNGGSKTVTQGQSVTNTVSAMLVSGTSQSVFFSASGLPAGTTATFSPTPCNPTCTSTPTGSYSITITGTAGTLSRTTSFTLSVTASNGVDTIPPSVAITSPPNGGRVSRSSTVTITAAASDNSVVTKVEFSVNGNLLCTDVSTPYTCTWKVPNRKQAYTLAAKAYDSAGNTAVSTVQVNAR